MEEYVIIFKFDLFSTHTYTIKIGLNDSIPEAIFTTNTLCACRRQIFHLTSANMKPKYY